MKNKALVMALIIGVFGCINLNAYMGDFDVFHKEKNTTNKEKVDCSDPKNRPRVIAGILMGGGEERVLS